MELFLQDVRVAVRSLLTRPGFTLVAVLTLGLGVGATTSIYGVVRAVLLEPLPHPEPHRLVTLWSASGPDGGERGFVSTPEFEGWRTASSFGSMAAYVPTTFTVTGLGEAEIVPGALASPGFFEVFGRPLALGRGFAQDEDVAGGPAVVVLAHGFWESRLGADPRALGRTVELNGVPHLVVGVAPVGFDYPAGARMWRPVQDEHGCGVSCAYLSVIGRLAPGATLDRARDELSTIARRVDEVYPEEGARMVELVPLHELLVGEARTGLLVVLGAVSLVLLIACTNVANLLLVRGASRSGEVAVRTAIGAGRMRIVGQLLTESLVLAVGGGVAGLLLALWGIDLLRAISPGDLPRLDRIALDGAVVRFACGLVLLTAVLFGLGPALHLARTPPRMAGLPGSGGRRPFAGRGWGRTAMLVVEVALSLVLLVGAGLLLKSFRGLQDEDLGFEPRGVLTFGVHLPPERYRRPGERADFFLALRDRLEADPRVEVVGVAFGSPLGSNTVRSTFVVAGRPRPARGDEPSALLRLATPEYFRSVRIPLLRGRFLGDEDRVGTERVAVVSESLARELWGRDDPVGERIVISGGFGDTVEPARVVGVVGDVRSRAVGDAPPAEIYLAYMQEPFRFATVHVRALPMTGGADVLRTLARNEVRALDPDLPPVGMESLESRVDAALGRSRFYLVLFGLFATVAVALAAVGLYGVVAYLVARRTKEIAVRVALGAEEAHVKALVVRQGLTPALGGIALGLVGALGLSRAMAGLLYRVEPGDPPTVLAVTGLLLAVVVSASLVPAGRAVSIAPSEALRSD